MLSPFPCSPVIRECSWKKAQIEKKKKKQGNDVSFEEKELFQTNKETIYPK